VRAALLQFPDATANPGKAAVGRAFPLAFQVTRGTQGQVNAFVKVVAGFPVAAPDIVGDVSLQKVAGLLEEALISVGEGDS
jgi:hypothetical protein